MVMDGGGNNARRLFEARAGILPQHLTISKSKDPCSRRQI
jgi:hypothetical protein